MHSKAMKYQGDFGTKENMRKPFQDAEEHMAYSVGAEKVSPAKAHLPKTLGKGEKNLGWGCNLISAPG